MFKKYDTVIFAKYDTVRIYCQDRNKTIHNEISTLLPP